MQARKIDFMTTPSVLRFSAKNGRLPEAYQPSGDNSFDPSDSRSLARRIALDTINQLIELHLVGADSAPAHLSAYRTHLMESSESRSILQFVFPGESELLAAQKRLAAQASVSVWEIAGQILPPAQFYRAHPAIADACRQCGSVILDATALATITTASVNPVAGRALATWMRSAISSGGAEQRSPFCFHVAVPPTQWPSIARSHFGAEVQCLSN